MNTCMLDCPSRAGYTNRLPFWKPRRVWWPNQRPIEASTWNLYLARPRVTHLHVATFRQNVGVLSVTPALWRGAATSHSSPREVYVKTDDRRAIEVPPADRCFGLRPREAALESETCLGEDSGDVSPHSKVHRAWMSANVDEGRCLSWPSPGHYRPAAWTV